MRNRKCGCKIDKKTPTNSILCERHATRAKRRAKREKVQEEKGLRREVIQLAEGNGHALTRFKEYPSVTGKWTAFCKNCGDLFIVYDEIPEAGDQIESWSLTKQCKKSALVAALAEEEVTE